MKRMKAFDDIYIEYANVVFKYLMSLTMDPYLSEELTQEAFYEAFGSLDKFDGKCKMRSLYIVSPPCSCQHGKGLSLDH